MKKPENNVNIIKPSQGQPFVSVIIPVRNDSERLKICLQSLTNQTYPKHLYEIIVVDNGSDEAVNEITSHFDRVLVIVEKHIGSYAARNKGISPAQGEIIAFTDSDCIPGKDWLERGVTNLLGHPYCGLVAGKVELFFKDPLRPTLIEIYESLTAFPQDAYIERQHFGATANIFTFKRVFDHVGLFNDKLLSGGDTDWGQRVFSFGYKQIYAQDTCVAHPARYSFSQLHKKIIRVVGGHYKSLSIEGGEKVSFLNMTNFLVRFLIPPIKTALRKVMYDARLLSGKDKLKFIFASIFIHYITYWEIWRLQWCGKSRKA